MYRAASRLPRRALLTASVAGAVTLHEKPRQKLPIYPEPTPDILLIETPTALETHIGVARRRVSQAIRDVHSYVQGWVSKWINIEHAVEHRVKAIISPQEAITPGLLYIGIATLTGSIFARNRSLATRLVLPPVFFFASSKHFLPKTTNNFSDYLGSLEDTYFPALAQKHDVAKAHTAMTWERIKEGTNDTRQTVNRGAVNFVEKVQEMTGLKLRETFGWAEEKKQVMEAKVVEVKDVIEEKAIEAKEVVETKVTEITEAVGKVAEQKGNQIHEEIQEVKKEVEEQVEKAEKKIEELKKSV